MLGVSDDNVEIKIKMSDGVVLVVLFSCDYVHVFKLWRNKFQDSKSIKYSDGMEFSEGDIL